IAHRVANVSDRPQADGSVLGACSSVFLSGKAVYEAIAFGGKLLVGHTALRIARIFRLQPIEKKHFELAIMLGFDGPAWLQFEQSLDVSPDGFRDIDLSNRFQARPPFASHTHPRGLANPGR